MPVQQVNLVLMVPVMGKLMLNANARPSSPTSGIITLPMIFQFSIFSSY